MPDYACTAHMVQGMTLPGLVAECGDVLGKPQLKDMLAACVALSRVKQADCLLLLCAFAPRLFRQGPPPGPHCLMKLLRARCAPVEGMTYTEDDAVAEFDELV